MDKTPLRAVLLAALFTAVALAGCADGDGSDTAGGDVVDKDSFDLASGKGAIAGLLVDDRFRPIQLTDDPQTEFQAEGFVLLQETGEQVQTTENGEFTFVDLAPGEYTLRVTAEGHEATPQKVSVVAGEFAEKTVTARRVTSEGSSIITQEYTVFVPCGYDYAANGAVTDCTFDQSGDSYRPGFSVNYSEFQDASYLVVEMLANQPYGYEVQLREDDGSSGGGERYAVAQFEGDYVKIVLEKDEVNEQWNGQNNNVAWSNAFVMDTILFGDSAYREEFQGAGLPVCCGVGVYFGIEAKFLHSLFLGEPEVDVEAYCQLCS